jgi:hypothetical protein
MFSKVLLINKKVMVCKGICVHYKANRPQSGTRYLTGQKRCQVCEIYITWKDIWCPCCSCRLRNGSRSSRYKLEFIRRRRERKGNNNKKTI